MTGAVQAGSGAVSVVASGASGLVVWGSVGAIATTAVAIVTLVLSVVAGNARRRRQYETDMREAEQRGRESVADDLAEARRERDDYRERYLNIVERRSRT